MVSEINIIVTCTKRKTVDIPDELRLRQIPKVPVEKKVELWRERLRSNAASTTTARQLYCGDHWSIVRSIDEVSPCQGTTVRFWVASAGYGLISLADRLKPYSATFSHSHPDSVSANTLGENRSSLFANWWGTMSKWCGPTAGVPRTITDLVCDRPTSPLVVIASENYLSAIKHDLQNAVTSLANPELLSIFSAGSKSLGTLSRHLVPYDARLQRVVGGALRSLNMRVARYALSECRDSVPTLPLFCKRLAKLSGKQPAFEQIERRPMTDAAVRRFIANELRRDRNACHSPLLRKFRDGDNACEQKRFANLYREVRGQLYGSE